MAAVFVVPKALLLAGTVLVLLGIYAEIWDLAMKGFLLFPISMLLWVAENELRHPVGRLGT